MVAATSRLTTFSDGVRGKSSKTSTDSGHVYFATPSASRKLLQILERGGGVAGVEDDRRAGALAQPVVGQRHDRDLVHGGVAQDHGLDLGRHDRHPAAADDVLAAPDVDELAVLVERSRGRRCGSRRQPVSDSRVSGSLLKKPRKRLGPLTMTDPTFPAGSGCSVVVDDLDLGAVVRAPLGREDLLVGLVEGVGGVAGDLREPVVAERLDARTPPAWRCAARASDPEQRARASTTGRASVSLAARTRSAECVGIARK